MLLARISRWVGWLKAFAGWLLFTSGAYRHLLGGRGVIVLFHRVDDRYPTDPITISTPKFDRFIRFFSRYFEIHPLGGLLSLLAEGQSPERRLAITFDDGYGDNLAVAAPILECHGTRACFFITTACIGSQEVPEWDRAQEIESEWMSWNGVRELRRRGHEIGAHTRTHLDLGQTTGAAAQGEIEGAKRKIEEELGESPLWFAYPFGGRHQMAPDNVALVKALGFRCCLSAYGGVIRGGDDLFALQRTAITGWFVSPYHFGFELLTGRIDQS